MRKKWEINDIELHYYEGTNESENQALAEITKVLYAYFRQLDRSGFKAQATVPATSNRRNGTDA